MTKQSDPQEKALKITLIGSEGTGKSAFLAGLAVLGLDAMNPVYSLAPQNNATAIYLNDLRESFIIHNAWPTPTLVTQLLDFNLTFQKKNLNIVTIDYGGELFREAFNQMKPEDMQAFSDHLRQSEVLLFLVDAEEVVAAQNNGKQFALGEKLRANLTAVQDSCKEFAKNNQDKFNEMELCIILTKADRIQELEGFEQNSEIARAFGEKYFGKTLLDKMDGMVKTENIRYFAVSSIGKNALNATDQTVISSQVHPEGYESLFSWIANRGKRRFKRWLIATAIFVLFIAICVGFSGFGGKVAVDELHDQKVQQAVNILDNKDLPFIERINSPEVLNFASEEKIESKRFDVFEERKTQLRAELAKCNDSKSVEELQARIEPEKDALQKETWKNDFQNILDECNQRIEECDFEEIKTLKTANRTKECTEQAYEFIRKFPKSQYRSDVQKILNDIQSDEIRIAREAVAKIANKKENLNPKSEKILDFLNKYGDQIPASETQQMRKAAEMGKAFAEKRQYKVKIKEFGGFNSSHLQTFIFLLGDKEIFHHENKEGKTITTDKEFTFDWQYGDKVELVLHAKYKNFWVFTIWPRIAKVTFKDENAIRCLSQGKTLLQAENGHQGKTTEGFFVKFEGSPYTEDDWKAFEAYFFPGDAWNQSKAEETK